MDGLARASGAPVPVQFNGETLLIDPITLRDYGTVEQHLLNVRRPNVIELATEVADKLTKQAEIEAADLLKADPKGNEEAARKVIAKAQLKADSLLNKAFENARKINTITKDEAMEFLDSPAGIAFTFWLKFDQRYPGRFSLNQVSDIIQKMSEDKLQELADARDQASVRDIQGNSTGGHLSSVAAPTAEMNLTNPAIPQSPGEPSTTI